MFNSLQSVEELIDHLSLVEHPEGGFFRETYRDKETKVQSKRGTRDRKTAIYYCMPAHGAWNWHLLLEIEETLYFHNGNPLEVYFIEDRKLVKHALSNDSTGNSQLIIPPNTWFAMVPEGDAPYTLMSAVCEPGFEYEDMLTADETILDELEAQYHDMARQWIAD